MANRSVEAAAVATTFPLESDLVGGESGLAALLQLRNQDAAGDDRLLSGAERADFGQTLDLLKEALTIATILIQAYRLAAPKGGHRDPGERRKDEEKLKAALPKVSVDLLKHVDSLVKAVMKLLDES